MITSQDMAEYRTDFDDRETAFMWQSLMFRMSYRCSYCMASNSRMPSGCARGVVS